MKRLAVTRRIHFSSRSCILRARAASNMWVSLYSQTAGTLANALSLLNETLLVSTKRGKQSVLGFFLENLLFNAADTTAI